MNNTMKNTTTKLRSGYPVAFKKCLPEALRYGKCVIQSADLQTKECEKEFLAYSKCFAEQLKKAK